MIRTHIATAVLVARLGAFCAPALSSRAFIGAAAILILGVLASFGALPVLGPDAGAVVGFVADGAAVPSALTAGLALSLLALGDMEELTALVTKQAEAWEAFKKANDARIAEVEKKGHASADALEKVGKIETDLTAISKALKAAQEQADTLEKRLNRPGAGNGGTVLSADEEEHKTAFQAYLRTGNADGLEAAQRKAMSGQSDPDGGFLVARDMDGAIDRIAAAVTAFRSIANVRTIGGGSYKKLVKTRGVAGGWIGESEDSSESNAPQYSEIEITAHRMYAEPWVPNDLLEDSMYDLEADLAGEAAITFGEVEGTAFINGTGVKQPRGILSYSPVANASYAWNRIGYIATGVSGDFAASNKGDKVIDLQHALKQIYRPGAVWLMNDATLAIMRQFKDGSGAFYLWNPDPASGPSGTFLGSRVVVDDYMPAIAANSYSVAYGNFQRGYTIVDRRGTAVIIDRVTKKGTSKFHMSRRVGGGVTNFEAIKLLKFGTS